LLLLITSIHAKSQKAEEVKAEWNRVICIALKILQFVSVGLAAIAIIVAGLKYMASSDDTDAREASKNIVMQAVGALVLVIVAVGIVNYLVTGTGIDRFDMGACSDILPATTWTILPPPTTTPGATTTTSGTSPTTNPGATSTSSTSTTSTTTPPSICLDPTNKCNKAIADSKNACERASKTSYGCLYHFPPSPYPGPDVDFSCGAGYAECCCNVLGYASCCKSP
jgi:hypothetical protein